MTVKTLFIALLLPLFAYTGAAQEKPGAAQETIQNKSVLQILNADSLVGSTVGNSAYRELIGNVRLQQDNVLIDCDRAVQNLTTNTVELIGNVVIKQDTLLLRTDRGRYDADKKTARSHAGVFLDDGHIRLKADIGSYNTESHIADFLSRVTIDDTSAVIRTDRMQYLRDSSLILAEGNVIVRFKNEDVVITADSALHYPDDRISLFPKNPVFWQIDTTVVTRDSLTGVADSLLLDTLSIVSGYMAAYRDSSNVFLTRDSVEIVRGNLQARCQTARFLRDDSLLILEQSPLLWYDRNQITGDSITIFIAGNEMKRMDVDGDAFSVSQSKPSQQDTLYPPGRFDQTKGQRIVMEFEENRIRQIRVEQSAISLYYLYEDMKLNGLRRESGDRIIMDFEDGKPSEIRTIGGVEGVYYPEKYVTGIEHSYDLEGFDWRTDRPEQPAMPANLFDPFPSY